MVAGTLYAASNNVRTFEILIAAKYGNSAIKIEHPKIELDPKKFPFGKLPYLQTSDGKTLTGSHAIATLVAEKSISGTQTPEQVAQIVQWFHLVDNEILPNVFTWVLPSVSAVLYNKNHVDEAKTQTLRLLNILNDYLLTRTYLVGERLSVADISVACSLLLVYQHVLEPENRKKLLNLTRWFETCVNQPNFKSILGEIHLCTKSAHFDQQKFKQFQQETCPTVATQPGQAKPAKAKDEKKKEKKETTPAASTKPKEKKEKPVENGEEEELDASEEALAREPKQNDPFAALAKGTFNIEEFKRVYSNEDTLTKALPYFWENFDPSAYSIWCCDYKYADELTLVFMSCNLIAGMFQRLDKMRKHAFGSMCLFGSDNNSTISGIWVWRGQDLAFTLSEDLKVDYESYNWKKLDPNSEETKKMVKEYFAWEGEFGGKKFNQGKIFK